MVQLTVKGQSQSAKNIAVHLEDWTMQQSAILCRVGDVAKRLVKVNDRGYPIGEDHHRSKLTDADIDLILELHFEHRLGYGTIAAKFDDVPGGLSKSQVARICRGLQRGQIAAATRNRPLDDGWRAFDPADPDDFDIVSITL